MKSRALAAFVRANPGIVGCVWFKYRNLELSLVGKWSRQEQEWSRGNEPRKSEGVSQAVVFVRTSRNAPCCWGGGGALRDGTKTAARKTSEEEAVIPIL